MNNEKLQKHYENKYSKKDLNSLVAISMRENLEKDLLSMKLTDNTIHHAEVHNRQNTIEDNPSKGRKVLRNLAIECGSVAGMLALSNVVGGIIEPDNKFTVEFLSVFATAVGSYNLGKIFDFDTTQELKRSGEEKFCELKGKMLTKQLERQSVKVDAIKSVMEENIFDEDETNEVESDFVSDNQME